MLSRNRTIRLSEKVLPPQHFEQFFQQLLEQLSINACPTQYACQMYYQQILDTIIALKTEVSDAKTTVSRIQRSQIPAGDDSQQMSSILMKSYSQIKKSQQVENINVQQKKTILQYYQLKEEYQVLRKDAEYLEANLVALNSQLSRVQERLDTVNFDKIKLQQRLDKTIEIKQQNESKSQLEIARLQEELLQTKKQLSDQQSDENNRLKQKIAEIKDLTQNGKLLSEQIMNYQAKLQQLFSENEDLRKQIHFQQLDNQCNSQRNTVQGYRRISDELKKLIVEKSNHDVSLNQQISALNIEIKKLQAANLEQEDTIFRSRNEYAMKEMQQQRQILALESENKKLTEEFNQQLIEKSNELNQEQQQTNRKMQTQLEELTSQYEYKQRNFNEDLIKKENIISALRIQLQYQEKHNEVGYEICDKIIQQQNNIKDLEAQLQDSRLVFSNCQNELSNAKLELATVKRQLQEEKAQRTVTNDQFIALQRQFNEYKKNNQYYEDNYQSLKQEMEELRFNFNIELSQKEKEREVTQQLIANQEQRLFRDKNLELVLQQKILENEKLVQEKQQLQINLESRISEVGSLNRRICNLSEKNQTVFESQIIQLSKTIAEKDSQIQELQFQLNKQEDNNINVESGARGELTTCQQNILFQKLMAMYMALSNYFDIPCNGSLDDIDNLVANIERKIE